MREILLTSSVLILALLILRRLFRKTVSRRVQYALWGLVLIRLLVPVQLPAVEHNVLTAAEPVRQTVAVQLEDRKLYVLPTEQVTLPAPEERAPELQPGTEMAVQSVGVMVVDEGGDTATLYTGWITAEEALRLVWYAGMAVMAAWFLFVNLRFARKLRKASVPYSVDGCRYPMYLVESGLPSPCLFGLLRPAIYLTPAAVASEDTVRHVLAHEMTHARHLDPLWSFLRCVCLVVYWFDPLVWIAAIASRKDCELACDEGALKRLGEAERIPYGQTLLRLIPVAKHPGSPLLSATTMTAGKKELKDRVTRIAENRRTVGVALLAVVTAAALVCAATFTGAKTHGEVLTYEELNSYSILLNAHRYHTRGRQFLTSTYDKPEDINVYQLLYNTSPFEGDYSREEPPSEQRQLVVDTYFDGVDPGIGLVRITGEEIDQILQPYTGLTLSEIDPRIMENFYYAEGYDTYYYFHTDSLDYSFVRFYAGERQENGDVSLYYRAEPFKLADTLGSNKEVWAKVTIRLAEDYEETNNYTFRSNQLCDRPDDLLGEIHTLTGEELTFFNEEFFNNDTSADGVVSINYHNQFLTCLYGSPQNIDLYNLLYCGIGSNEGLSAEEQALVGNLDLEGIPICPTDKMSTAAIDAFLLENTGSPLTEAQKSELEACFTYLPEYDAYYHSHGDTNYYSGVRFTGGQRVGDYIHLYYYDYYYNGGGCNCLTLLDRGEGNYWFVANQITDDVVTSTVYPEEEPWLTLPLDDLSPAYPLNMGMVRHYDDCAQRGGGIGAERSPGDPSYTVRPYLSTDGNLYLAVIREEAAGRDGMAEWTADVFFTVPQENLYNTVDNVSLFFFDDLLGYEYGGFTFTYSDYITGGYIGDVTDYYVIDAVGTPSLIARAYGDCDVIDLDGDGENELCAASGASGQVFFCRDGQIYEADIKALLAEAWPELLYWEGGDWDSNYRRMAVYGSVEMPGWGDGSASFTRYVYLDEDGLLVYKPTEKTVTDHVVGTPDVPDDVLAAAKASVLTNYQDRHNNGWLSDAKLDDWRIESLTYETTYDYSGASIAVYRMNYEFHAQNPAKVMLAGGSYITEDAWCMIGYPYCNYLFFLEQEGQRTFLETRMINDGGPGSETFKAEMDAWAVELGLFNLADTADEQLLNLFCNSPRQFITQLAEMEETEQRTLCHRLWAYQKDSGASSDGYEQALYIQGIQALHTIRQSAAYPLDEREAAAFDILLQEAHADEAAAQVQTILNALTAQGSIRLSFWDSPNSSDFTFTHDPAKEAVAAFSDNFYWADTGVLPTPVWGRSSRLILTSAKEDITLTVFEYSPERVCCTYHEQTYAFLAASRTADAAFDYFFEWFDEARYDAMPWLDRDA